MSKQTFRLRNNFILNILFAFSSFMLALFGLLILLPPAETEIASAVIDGETYDLAITTNESINLELTPTLEGSIAIAKDTITATTNSPSGYKLYVSTDTDTNNIYLNGNDANNTDDMVIKGVTGTYETPLPLNTNNDNNLYATWGYAVAGLNNFDNTYSTTNPSSSSRFAGLPTKNNEQLIHDHEGTASSDTTEIYYGVKANTNLSAGNYQTEILYTTITDASNIVNGEATITPNELEEGYEATIATIQTSLKTTRELGTISVTIGNQACTNIQVVSEDPVILTCSIQAGIRTEKNDVVINFSGIGKSYVIDDGITINLAPIIMQTMTPALCTSLAEGQSYQLIDSRDNKTYTGTKLADGNCWMTQDLALNLGSPNLAAGYDNGTLTPSDTNILADWMPARSTGSVITVTNEDETTTNIDPNWVDDNNTPYSTIASGVYYYNWSAAVASNDTSSYTFDTSHNFLNSPQTSICPKGWRLPDGSNAGEFKTLNDRYSNGVTDDDGHLLRAPVSFSHNGYISAGMKQDASTGYYWSSTVSNNENTYGISFTSKPAVITSTYGYVETATNMNRFRGTPIRCVAEKESMRPTITYDANGGTNAPSPTSASNLSGHTQEIIITDSIPNKTDETFAGWNTNSDGSGDWYGPGDTILAYNDITLYALYVKPYHISYNANGGTGASSEITIGSPIIGFSQEATLSDVRPTREGFYFDGWSTNPNSEFADYRAGKEVIIGPSNSQDVTLYAIWRSSPYTVIYSTNGDYSAVQVDGETVNRGSDLIKHYDTYDFIANATADEAVPCDGGSYDCLFMEWTVTPSGTYTPGEMLEFPIGTDQVTIYARYQFWGCVMAGTLITLADGSQVPVESLSGDEELLAWDFENGEYAARPIVFIDPEPINNYRIIRTVFSDGTYVDNSFEHGYFDLELKQFIYINENNPEQYIGHHFIKQSTNNEWEAVELIDIQYRTEHTTLYGLNTFGTINFYVNGMLSIEGNIAGMFNYFNVDTNTMTYDPIQKAADLARYGEFTAADFEGVISELGFEAFNGKYLKVAIGKGLITWDKIRFLANIYGPMISK